MAENNNSKVSSYISSIKDWKIQEIISGYLNALLILKISNKSIQIPINVSFSNLRKMCDILYDVKENFHLIFKRVLNPKKQIFEQANKLIPSEREIEFMNNIGLLFHRVMVAREQRYLLDYYEKDSEGQDTRTSFKTNITKITRLFKQGLDLLMHVLEDYPNNINLISYFIDNNKELMPIFGKKYDEILKILSTNNKTDDAYFKVVEYYLESGWNDKAILVLKEFIKMKPKHEHAVGILKNIRKVPKVSY